MVAADRRRTERGEMAGHELAIEQGEMADPQPRY
jgi:hypothetical protein